MISRGDIKDLCIFTIIKDTEKMGKLVHMYIFLNKCICTHITHKKEIL